ncbi:MAG: HPr family phosphocarrier protein [Planctomycetes bacterium]|nr:HPr family phosphocarrier protein [Planctomycetota bacterium]
MVERMAGTRASRLVTVCNAQGIHARPADMFVRLANRFDATITVIKDGERFDGKSILSLMTLGAGRGTQLVLQADGTDADAALDALAELFGRGFDEMGVAEPAKDQSTEG